MALKRRPLASGFFLSVVAHLFAKGLNAFEEIHIDDDKLHKVTWVRYKDGTMNVLIDNDNVLETHEVYFKNKFTGIEIENKGGNYQWASIEISKASEQHLN